MSGGSDVWSVRRLLDWTRHYLERQGVDSPKLSAEYLLAHVLGCDRLRLFLRLDEQPTEAHRATFRELVRRRAQHTPLGHLTGQEMFFGRAFEVGPDVLIPRPETEMLVEAALAALAPAIRGSASVSGMAPSSPIRDEGFGSGVGMPPPPAEESSATAATAGATNSVAGQAVPNGTPPQQPSVPGPQRVLDLCTGSGCIAVTLAAECPTMSVTAVDVCPRALAVARRNAQRWGVADRVTFVASDLYTAVIAPPVEPLDGATGGGFDLIAANPPYIPSAVIAQLEPTVRDYDPHLALDGGPDGLAVLRPLILGAGAFLRPGGLLLIEIGYDQAAAVEALAHDAGNLGQIEIRRDFAGQPRLLWCRRVV